MSRLDCRQQRASRPGTTCHITKYIKKRRRNKTSKQRLQTSPRAEQSQWNGNFNSLGLKMLLMHAVILKSCKINQNFLNGDSWICMWKDLRCINPWTNYESTLPQLHSGGSFMSLSLFVRSQLLWEFCSYQNVSSLEQRMGFTLVQDWPLFISCK